MPLHADFQKVKARFIEQYGQEKGESLFYAWKNKHKLDDTKPMPEHMNGKEIKISDQAITFKEEKGEYYSKGFIATTHKDKVGDKILKDTLENWAHVLNNSVDFQANPVSIHHDREDVNLVGLGKTAKVEKLADGEFGLFVETHHNKTHPSFEDTKYQIDNNFLTHYSIEYDTNNGTTTHKENQNGEWVRIIEPSTELYGYGLASPRTVVNPNAQIVEVGYKELLMLKEHFPIKTDLSGESELKEKEHEVNKMEQKTETIQALASEAKEIDAKSFAKSFLSEVKEAIKTELKSITPLNAPMQNAGEKIEKKEHIETKEQIEFKERLVSFKEGVLKNKLPISEQWKVATRIEKSLKERGLPILNGEEFGMEGSNSVPFEIKENKLAYKENRLDFKAAVLVESDPSGTTTSSYPAILANYEQAPARYNDIYGPVIINQLNEMQVTWNKLTKEDHSGMSAIRIRARTGRNATAGSYAYGSTPGWDSSIAIKKFNLHYVTSYVEVQLEDEAIEYARSPGGIGDAYAEEVSGSTLDLMNYLNGSSGIYGTGDGTSESVPIGLDGGLIIVTGNLYGKDVTASGYTTLAAAGVDAMSSAKITLGKLRAMYRATIVKGAEIQNLAFFTSYLQYHFIYALIQDMQRLVPTSARAGFTGVLELDSIPVFPDPKLDENSMTDDIFLLDMAHTKLAIKKAPTYVEFGKVTLHRRGIVWMMWNLYSDAPSHNYHINGLATS